MEELKCANESFRMKLSTAATNGKCVDMRYVNQRNSFRARNFNVKW